MPNIVVIGNFITKNQITEVVESLGKKFSDDAVITTLVDSFCLELTGSDLAPYIVVRDTNKIRGRILAKTLNERLNIDVEFEQIEGFFPKKK